MAEEVREALIYHYRLPEDRALIGRFWCQLKYGGDKTPEIVEMIKEDLEKLNHVQLAYLYRMAIEAAAPVSQMPDNYDPWK